LLFCVFHSDGDCNQAKALAVPIAHQETTCVPLGVVGALNCGISHCFFLSARLQGFITAIIG